MAFNSTYIKLLRSRIKMVQDLSDLRNKIKKKWPEQASGLMEWKGENEEQVKLLKLVLDLNE